MAEDPIDVAERNRAGHADQDDNGFKLSLHEKKRRTFKTKQQVWTPQIQFLAFCDICFLLNFTQISASYLCYLCSKYLCAKCNERHDNSHSMVEKESTGDERDGQIKRFLDEIRKESESERMEMFNRADVSFVDKFSVKHELDKRDKCWITGLCGLDATRWVICDNFNYCIKVYSIDSHILQRYIRFGCRPFGVTAIKVKQEPTEQGVMAATDMSASNQSKSDKQCLLAVTLPWKRRIWFINLTQNPANITKSIKTKKHCWDIAFSGDQIVTVCNGEYPGYVGRWFITVLSTGGVELKTINTSSDLYEPRLAVCPGRFYLTDWGNKVLCMNDEGKVVSHNTIKGSWLEGISVDPDTEKVYISDWYDSTLYRLNSRLESLECLFEFNTVITEHRRLCVHRDRLYVSHGPRLVSTVGHIVSVVRVI